MIKNNINGKANEYHHTGCSLLYPSMPIRPITMEPFKKRESIFAYSEPSLVVSNPSIIKSTRQSGNNTTYKLLVRAGDNIHVPRLLNTIQVYFDENNITKFRHDYIVKILSMAPNVEFHFTINKYNLHKFARLIDIIYQHNIDQFCYIHFSLPSNNGVNLIELLNSFQYIDFFSSSIISGLPSRSSLSDQFSDLYGNSAQLVYAKKSKDKPAISVVTVYKNRIKNIDVQLKSLLEQNMDHEKIEWVIVDDASDDWKQKGKFIKNKLSHLRLQCQYIHVPVKSRGTELFRAGECRNIGADFSRADTLTFLDSDMLISPSYLNYAYNIIRTHQWSLVVGSRMLLPQGITKKLYANSNIKKFLGKQSHGYPLDKATTVITNSNKELMEHNDYWSMFASNNFTLSKKTFFRVGGFDPVYAQYALEDLDFGYRCYINDVDFHYHELMQTFHLHHSPSYKVERREILRQAFEHHFRKYPTYEMLRAHYYLLNEEERNAFEKITNNF